MRTPTGSVLCESHNHVSTRSEESAAKDLLRSMLEKQSLSTNFEQKEQHISGNSIGDIPSRYTIPPMRRHEKAVVGTFIDPTIVPGFRYTVRLNGSTETLFNSECKYLEAIGQGYGKRLTFESEDILQNDNFFWSDSSSTGYAFSINVLKANETFRVFDNNQEIGSAHVESVSDEQEIIKSTNDETTKEHIKDVQVNFTCRFSIPVLQSDFSSDVAGVVTVVKDTCSIKASIRNIMALLLPSGKVLVLKPT